MNAAQQSGMTLSRSKAYGYSVPDSFTHGTSEQRMRWFKRGYQYGDLQHGDTFSLSDSELLNKTIQKFFWIVLFE